MSGFACVVVLFASALASAPCNSSSIVFPKLTARFSAFASRHARKCLRSSQERSEAGLSFSRAIKERVPRRPSPRHPWDSS